MKTIIIVIVAIIGIIVLAYAATVIFYVKVFNDALKDFFGE